MDSRDRINALQLLLENEPNDSFLNYALALEFHKQGDTVLAIQKIEMLLQSDESYLGAYLQLGQLYEQMDEPEKAKSIYQKGCVLANVQKNRKAYNELQQSIELLEN